MLLELTLALTPILTSGEEVLGPPAVCHPFAIGDAPSLPWKAGAFGFDPEFPLDRLNPELEHLLNHQGDTLVQLEAVRRAVVYAVGFGRTKELSLTERKLHTESLVSMLRGRVVAAELAIGKKDVERRVRAYFHLGYALAAIDQLDWDHDLGDHFGDGRDELKPALQWEGVDAGMCLGAALAMWISEPDDSIRDNLLLKAAKMAGPEGGLLTKNLVACGERFYGQDSYEALVKHLQKRVAAS